ncbi:MAG TPA: hypothetical protein VIV88_18685 [Gemmatimonadales bacterium]|jgi:hypothetical protein
MQRTDTIFLNVLDQTDPELMAAARHIDRTGLLRVICLPPGEGRPREPHFSIVPDEAFKDHNTYNAIVKVCEVPGVIIRWASEVPTKAEGLAADEARARARGFTETEIETHLRPWVAEFKAAQQAAMWEAEKDYKSAVENYAQAVEGTHPVVSGSDTVDLSGEKRPGA